MTNLEYLTYQTNFTFLYEVGWGGVGWGGVGWGGVGWSGVKPVEIQMHIKNPQHVEKLL